MYLFIKEICSLKKKTVNTNISYAVERFLDLIENVDLRMLKDNFQGKTSRALSPIHYPVKYHECKICRETLLNKEKRQNFGWQAKHPVFFLTFKIKDAQMPGVLK